ncbi:MAG: DUF4340 domain-containing protein [Gammaproteobacteria bacterium]
MRSRLLLNLGLLCLVLVLVLIAVYQPGRPPPAEPARLTKASKESIQLIRIIRKHQDDIVLRKEGHQWWMEEPITARADDYRASSILGILDAESEVRLDANQTDRARFKLDDPRIQLALGELIFAFGNANPLGQQRYVLFNDTIYLTDDRIYHHLIADAANFVSLQLLPIDARLTAIQLPIHQLQWLDGTWSVTPEAPDISMDAVLQLVDAWRMAKALFVRRYQEDTQLGPVRLTTEQGQSFNFAIMATSPTLILARPELGIQYHFSEAATKDLLALDDAP